jgi:integrase
MGFGLAFRAPRDCRPCEKRKQRAGHDIGRIARKRPGGRSEPTNVDLIQGEEEIGVRFHKTRQQYRAEGAPTFEMPKVRFHDLRHTHASALIAGGLDVVAISRRLGHASPVVTLSVYAHLFTRSDEGAAAAIEAAMRKGAEQ